MKIYEYEIWRAVLLFSLFWPYLCPTYPCSQTYCTGSQSDKIVHRIQHQIIDKVMYNNLGT